MSSSPSPRAAVLSMSVAALVSAALTIVAAQQPSFRAGIDVVRIDVSVFDKNHRPVRGLTADDFTILEDGKPQPIVAFEAVDISTAIEDRALWQRTHGPDVQSNELDTQRLVVVVLDDIGMPFDPGLALGAKRIAHETIRSLEPFDLSAVVFTGFGRNQNFTRDREQLDRAIDTLVPRANHAACPAVPPKCQIDTLLRIGNVLKGGPVGRKVIAYVGLPLPHFFPHAAGAFQAAVDALRQANVAVYVFDPRGLRTLGGNAEYRGGGPPRLFLSNAFPSLPEITGGREVIEDNEPWDVIPDMMRDTGSYYLIGYRSTHTKPNGEYRQIQIKVKGRDLQAFTRDGYFGPRAKKAGNEKQRQLAPPIDTTLANGLPVRGIPLRLSVAGFAGAGDTPGKVALTTGVGLTNRASADEPGNARTPIDLVATVLDDRWKPVATFTQTLDVGSFDSGANPWFDVLTKFSVPPGRYEVRVAAQRGDVTGSVFADIDVPDASKVPLSISDLTLSSEPLRYTVAREALADLLPKSPTSAREFLSSDRVSAFVRLYQGGHERHVVTVVARVVNDQDQIVWSKTTSVGIDDFTATGGALYTLELPMAGLTSSTYLLTVDATMGTLSLKKHLIFNVVR